MDRNEQLVPNSRISRLVQVRSQIILWVDGDEVDTFDLSEEHIAQAVKEDVEVRSSGAAEVELDYVDVEIEFRWNERRNAWEAE